MKSPNTEGHEATRRVKDRLVASGRQLLQEPLVHFLLIGAGLFVLSAWVGGSESPSTNRIVLSQADIERVLKTWKMKWSRPPTPAELAAVMEDHVREEVLHREALALGLDRDDTIIRRRLAQKMEFLYEDLTAPEPPSDSELESWLEDNPQRYRIPVRVSFVHIYISPDRRGDRAEADARSLLAELRRGPETVQPSSRGDRFMLQHEYAQRPEPDVARLFGARFASSVVELEPGGWRGPIESGYGLHLVRVTERLEATIPALSDVRDRVVEDFQYEQRRKANESIYTSLRARYRIEVEEGVLDDELARRIENPEARP